MGSIIPEPAETDRVRQNAGAAPLIPVSGTESTEREKSVQG